MPTALRKTPCLEPQTRPVFIAPAHQQRLFTIFFTRFGEKQRHAVNEQAVQQAANHQRGILIELETLSYRH